MTFLRNLFSILTGRLLAVVLSGINSILIARMLGVEGNGIYSLFLLLSNTLMLVWNLGLPSSFTYFLASKKNSFKEVLNYALCFGIFLFLTGLASVLLLSFFGAQIFFEGMSSKLYLLSFITFFLLLLNALFLSAIQGKESFKSYSVLIVIQPIFFLLGLLIPVLNRTVENVALLFLISQFSQAIFIFVFCRESIFSFAGFNPKWMAMKKYLRYGIKNHLSNVLTLINYKADLLFVSYFLGPFSLGIYSISVLIAEKIWILSSVVITVVFPKLSSIANYDLKKENLTIIISKWALILSVLASIIILISGEFFIELLFGIEYLGSVLPLFILLPGICATSMARVISTDIASRDRSELNFYVSGFTVSLNLVLNWILIPNYGVEGAAIATSSTYFLNLILKVIIFQKLISTSLRKYFTFSFEIEILQKLRRKLL